MTDWKRLYTNASIMLAKYQDEIVPGLRELLSQKWIPVTERLPDLNIEPVNDIDGIHYLQISDFVLGYTDKGECVVVQHEVNEFRDWWMDFGCSYHTVTHWMPLPQPPKGE